MDLPQLIEALSKPAAYPYSVQRIEVRQTHISVVFLAGAFAYKVKKPVNLGFLDFSTLKKRKHFCEEEVRLNRRLAERVYLGVVPITHNGTSVQFEGTGDPVEWAVKMERLPEGTSLLDRLERDEVTRDIVELVARKIAAFHSHAESGPHIASFGNYDVVAQNARENFEQSAAHVGLTVSRNVFDRLKSLTEESLNQSRPLIESRAAHGVPRDTHGDLHLDHVYYFAERETPNDLIVIDCIEFNERFRYADPIADAAFLTMDFAFNGRRDLANVFSEAYIRASDDHEGAALLQFYAAYRAVVRAKVEGFKLLEKEIDLNERESIRNHARAHWLLALGELEKPSRRPCLVLVGGLPGSGKSTLARLLAGQGGFTVIRTDVIRKELAGIDPHISARSSFDEGIYARDWTARTYTECRRRAEGLLADGERVIVDGSFGAEGHRLEFLAVAERLCVPSILLLCQVNAVVAEERIGLRRGDASDADQYTYRRAAENWQPIGTVTRGALREVSTAGTREDSLARAVEILRREGLIN